MSAPEPVTELLEKGDELAGSNKPAEALTLYDRALTLDASNTSALARKVFVLMGQGRLHEALRCQDQLVALDPRNPERLVDQANLLLTAGDDDAAIGCLERAVRLAPWDPRLLQRLGHAYRSSGRADRALEVYEHALSLAPEKGDLWAAKADALIDAQRADEGVEALEHAAHLDPQFSDADWNLRADRFYILTEYDRAAELYRRAIGVRPNVASWRGLGQTFQANGQMEEALRCYEEALALEPSNVELLNDRGFVLLELKMTVEAQACFRKVVELEPESLEGWLNLGATYDEMDDPWGAHEAYTRAARLDPDRADTWVRVGVCELGIGERGAALWKALTSFQRAAELDDHSYWAWNDAGYVLAELGNYDEAMTRLDRAIELDPSETTAWRNKMSLLLKQDHLPDAERCMERMFDAASDRAAALLVKATLLADWLGRDKDALESLREAARLRPDDESIPANLAEVLLKIGRYAEARTTAQRVLARTGVLNTQCAMLFFVWASHVLEDGESGARAQAFVDFMDYYRDHYVAGPGRRMEWNYRGLERAIRDLPASAESRFVLTLSMDLQEGKLLPSEMSFFARHSELTATP